MRQRCRWISSLSRRELVISLLLGLFFAFGTWAVVHFRFSILALDVAGLPYSKTISSILIIAAGMSGTAFALLTLKKASSLHKKLCNSCPIKVLPLHWDKKSVAQTWLVLLILWLPYVILQYPGGISFDTYNQLYQFIAPAPTYYDTLSVYYDAEFIDHHPLFSTIVFGLLFSFGCILGSQKLGLFLCMLFQVLLSTFAFAASCCYLKKQHLPKILRLVALLFCGTFPFLPLWATTVVKDSIHLPFLILFFICYIETFTSKGQNLLQNKWLITLIVFSSLAAMTKKIGTPIIIASLAVLTIYILLLKKQENVGNNKVKLYLVLCIMFPLCITFMTPPLLYPILGGVQSGGTQEAFGMPLQQVISTIRNENDLTPQEIKTVGNVIDINQAIQQWNNISVDDVKKHANPNASFSEWIQFFKAYIQIGLRHPARYTTTCLDITCEFFGPGSTMSYYRSSYQGWQYNYFNEIYGEELRRINFSFNLFPPNSIAQTNFIFARTLQSCAHNPFLAFIFSIGLWGSWLPLFCALLSIAKSRKNIVVFIPIILSLAILLICPVARTRYILPMLYTMPLQFGILYNSFRT